MDNGWMERLCTFGNLCDTLPCRLLGRQRWQSAWVKMWGLAWALSLGSLPTCSTPKTQTQCDLA